MGDVSRYVYGQPVDPEWYWRQKARLTGRSVTVTTRDEKLHPIDTLSGKVAEVYELIEQGLVNVRFEDGMAVSIDSNSDIAVLPT